MTHSPSQAPTDYIEMLSRFSELPRIYQACVYFVSAGAGRMTYDQLFACLTGACFHNVEITDAYALEDKLDSVVTSGFLHTKMGDIYPTGFSLLAMEHARENRELERILEQLLKVLNRPGFFGAGMHNKRSVGRRNLLWSLFNVEEPNDFRRYLESYEREHDEWGNEHPIWEWCHFLEKADFFDALGSHHLREIYITLMTCAQQQLLPCHWLVERLNHLEHDHKTELAILNYHFICGHIEELERRLAILPKDDFYFFRACYAVLKGKPVGELFHWALALKNKIDEDVSPPWLFGFYYLSHLLRLRNSAASQEAIAYLENCGDKSSTHWKLWHEIFMQMDYQKDPYAPAIISHNRWPSDSRFLSTLTLGLVHAWLPGNAMIPNLLYSNLETLHQNGYHLLAGELAAIILKTQAHTGNPLPWSDRLPMEILATRRAAGIRVDMVDAYQAVQIWEKTLERLVAITQTEEEEPPAQPTTRRLVWLVSVYNGRISAAAREQKHSNRGWSKGRVIPFKKLLDDAHHMSIVTDQDLALCRLLRKGGTQWGFLENDYYLDEDALPGALVGHPLLFRADDPKVRVEVVRGKCHFVVQQKHNDVQLSCTPAIGSGFRVWVEEETPTRFSVIDLSEKQMEVIAALKSPLLIPMTEEKRIRSMMSSMAGIMPIQAHWGDGIPARNVPPCETIFVLLLPMNRGLTVRLRVRPLDDMWMMPGEGARTLLGEVEQAKVQTARNLHREQARALEIVETCQLDGWDTGPWEWELATPELCIPFLSELKEMDGDIELMWPEGEVFKVWTATPMDVGINIQHNQDWFELRGEVKVGKDLVIAFQKLLKLVGKAEGPFISLGQNGYVRLNQQLYYMMTQIGGCAQRIYGDKVRVHRHAPLTLNLLSEIVDEKNVDEAWLRKQREMQHLEHEDPPLPEGLNVAPRAYQIEGFKWLYRLSAMGAGACLADDMGLGKTLQALMVALTRANKGPTLVIAPSSVLQNWFREIQRFTPDLNPMFLDPNPNRRNCKPGPMDVLITSYALLQRERLLLRNFQWQTMILDEAQTIKNPEAKTTMAAKDMTAQFKIALSGTPIENHLTELWSIFDFLNPGLLGIQRQFHQHFAGAEIFDQVGQRRILRKIIGPFILRRLKNDVLDELPPKTEVVLRVVQNEAERAFYEGMRRKAVQKADHSWDSPKKALKIFALLTRMRRCCCHPSLVLDMATLAEKSKELLGESSKIQMLGRLLDDLLANGHKVLIFSQFIDHLSLIRNMLDKREIQHQYLDGRTPRGERQKRIDAFQEGQGNVFLISLKAGGLGLNLTAADFVIHMDPWWNPAVEDQASDRAHRLGQEKPVTVYRLITKDTIEEKMMELHERKRQLAQEILETGGSMSPIGAEQMLSLLRGEDLECILKTQPLPTPKRRRRRKSRT